MNILILNWRDIKNPKSGGAEILTHEMAKRWVEKGHTVVQFASEFEGSLREEVMDGVRIIRRGHPDARFLLGSVHFLAFIEYIKNFRGKFDVVVDEIHGLPFFTPFYVRAKKVVLICEVAGDLWNEMFGPFFGSLGRVVEKIFLKYLYKSIYILTISDSSKSELIRNGVKEESITVLPMGLNFPTKLISYEKEEDPTLIFVGRLSKSKGITDAIISLERIAREIPRIKLWVAGRGDEEYLILLKKLANSLGVGNRIRWFGFVDEDKKFELLGRAHILLVPSIKEGWGLTVPEAAFAGTPSVVYNSPGLRDVLKGSIFKTMVKTNTPASLAEECTRILNDKGFFSKLAKQKLNREEYNWDYTAELALEVLKK